MYLSTFQRDNCSEGGEERRGEERRGEERRGAIGGQMAAVSYTI